MQPVSLIPSSSSSMDILPRQPPLSLCNHHSDAPFPAKLCEMLEYAEQSGLSDVVSWLPHGKSFKIHNDKKFMSDVANLFFRATKLRSIHRQLNLWGFKRIAIGEEKDSWRHPRFLRGQPGEMCKMVRTKVKSSRGKTSQENKCDHAAPSFVQMSPFQPRTPDGAQQLKLEPILSDLRDEEFDRMCMMAIGEPQHVVTPSSKPRRVSMYPSQPVPECIVSGGGEGAPPQAMLMPRAAGKLARRDRYQGSREASSWMMPSRPTSIDIEPLTFEPLPLGGGSSNVTADDPSSVDEFSLFIGQMIQDPY